MPQPTIRHGYSYKPGDTIKLDAIQVGDDITFSTPDRPSKAGVVARIMTLDPTLHGPNRKVAFLDSRGYVLNSFPDGGTDATFTVPTPKQEATSAAQRAERRAAKRKKQFRDFRKRYIGTIYGDEISKYTNSLYIKIAWNEWVYVEAGPRGSFDISKDLDDLYVYENLVGMWEDNPLRMPAPIFYGKFEE